MNLKLLLRFHCCLIQWCNFGDITAELIGKKKKIFVNCSSLSELNQLVGIKEFNFINSIDDSSSESVTSYGKKHVPPI